MCDSAAAIYNGICKVFDGIKPGKCYFHMKTSMKKRHFDNQKLKDEFLKDLSSLSKSHSINHFESSLLLFKNKYVNHSDSSVNSAMVHFEKYWLTEANVGWHSGVMLGTVTTNNGVESTNRVFKRGLNGMCTVLFNVYAFTYT